MREPARFPWRLSDQLCRASARAASPDERASLYFSRHQGAWSSFSAFLCRRSAYRFQPRRGALTVPNMHSSNSRSAMDARTCSSPQLKAKRAAPTWEASARLLRGGRVQGKAVCLVEPHVTIIAHPFVLAAVPSPPPQLAPATCHLSSSVRLCHFRLGRARTPLPRTSGCQHQISAISAGRRRPPRYASNPTGRAGAPDRCCASRRRNLGLLPPVSAVVSVGDAGVSRIERWGIPLAALAILTLAAGCSSTTGVGPAPPPPNPAPPPPSPRAA